MIIFLDQKYICIYIWHSITISDLFLYWYITPFSPVCEFVDMQYLNEMWKMISILKSFPPLWCFIMVNVSAWFPESLVLCYMVWSEIALLRSISQLVNTKNPWQWYYTITLQVEFWRIWCTDGFMACPWCDQFMVTRYPIHNLCSDWYLCPRQI